MAQKLEEGTVVYGNKGQVLKTVGQPTPYQQPLQPRPVNTTPVIPAESLKKSPSAIPNLAPTPRPSNVAPLVESTVAKQPPALAEPVQPTAKETIQSKILELASQDTTKQKEQIRQDAQLAEKEQAQRNLYNDITARKRYYEQRIEDLEKNPEGKLTGSLNQEIEDVQRRANRELADMSIQYNVALGDYNAAQNIVEARINDLNEQRAQQAQLWQTAYNFVQNDMTESEKVQAQQAFQEKQNERNFEQQKEIAQLQAYLSRQNAVFESELASQLAGSSGSLLTDAGKPLNDTQATALGYAERLVEADRVIKNLGKKFVSAMSFVGEFLPNQLKSSDRQQYEQAQRNFVNAVLRKESGAVISPEEFNNARKQYFPQSGDSAATVAQKATNRNTVTQNLYRAAGVLGQVQSRNNAITRPEDLRAKYNY